ncbi:MAG: twin-arginine translocation signal domain-containing protein [Chloroflexales bacterium]|nr:twin-arginine translocation signal domain-containing protein [Chloroflexales bacterium]
MSSTPRVSRRDFLKLTAGGFAVGGVVSLVDLQSTHARVQTLKIADAKEYPSVCPYCAVGCGTLISVKNGKVINIEGNPDSFISRGTLCPKGAATFQLTVNPLRSTKALYRKPGATDWEAIDLNTAMDMIAERVKKTREETFVETVKITGADGNEVEKKVNHTLGIFSLGGATMDNEWNYAQLKLMRGLGVAAIENQARI